MAGHHMLEAMTLKHILQDAAKRKHQRQNQTDTDSFSTHIIQNLE